jgi:hypothetical protein
MSDIKKLFVFNVACIVELAIIFFSSALLRSLSTDLCSLIVFFIIWLAITAGSILLMLYFTSKIFLNLSKKDKSN